MEGDNQNQDSGQTENPENNSQPEKPFQGGQEVAAIEAPSQPLPPATVSSPQPKKSLNLKINIGSAKSYLVEYVISLFVLGGLLLASNTLFGTLINNWAGQTTENWLSSFEHTLALSAIASLIVSLPIFAILHLRVRAAEVAEPKILHHRWREFVYNLFMVILGLVIVSTLVGLVYNVVKQIDATGDFAAGSSWWAGYAKTVFSLALVSFVFWYYYKIHISEGGDQE
jgi:hypothetical protein